jgi:hypothetical protein
VKSDCFIMSVSLSIHMEQLVSNWMHFCKILFSRIIENIAICQE